ncbi:UNVERIFIED_ORG: K+-transporting ATPase ATPase C chain [Kosakonia oryzae]|uniref:Potassium-transporting ATPase KdpC subunit n=1 Tax=Kosakonia radicincitans TaxID=283686 RepID=A0AAX2EMJ6_9ENTR|nr:potassium-transporting ATPase subunit KdpC [Kosakonia radicincitans]MDP9564748.1 K+-transporting ATPase ATPase C chain [Kosakonia oryzae]SFD96745.1 K+-transporting ATPase ATPase C chain [Kosakonia radicincitans]SFQ99034.1 K+-transporting ATPase ATPase C chain [Kosakonia radicincitans]SFT44994.1 K+-transporting ATPase ATPase C chain [Kosakonia radicincitans]SFX15498.1 K+-transporting ATPase ATPase C chain [Kosakonia radicincitans]
MALLRPAFLLLLLFTLITGGIYPLVTTALGQWWFNAQANGSLIREGDTVRGSRLLGQDFTAPVYFHGRPSATADAPYNPMASGGSNLAGSNPELDKEVAARVAQLRAENPQADTHVPVELITTSASGLDGQLSPAATTWQIPRVAQARHLPVTEVEKMVAEHTTTPLVNFIGQPVVNIVELNLALDALKDK